MTIAPDPLTRKRVSILHRYFTYVCDVRHPFGAEDLIALRQRFAKTASVIKNTHTEEQQQFMTLSRVCSDPTPDRIAQLYENMGNLEAMARIAFPRLASPFSN